MSEQDDKDNLVVLWEHVRIELNPEDVDRLDELATQASTASHTVTHAQMVRKLVMAALERQEREDAAPRSRRRLRTER